MSPFTRRNFLTVTGLLVFGVLLTVTCAVLFSFQPTWPLGVITAVNLVFDVVVVWVLIRMIEFNRSH